MVRHARRHRRALWLAVAVLLAPLVLASCGGAPQVLSIQPARGSGSIHSNAAIRIVFSTAMNQRSVEEHFSLQPVVSSLLSVPWVPHAPLGPDVKGTFSWPTPETMIFQHPVLWAGTHYQVVLDAGFEDTQGGANPLRHSWIFETDNAPELTGAGPADGATQVPIDQYLNVSFGYKVDPGSLTEGSITLTPATPVVLRRDPTDPYNVIIAPQRLLTPWTTYHLQVTKQIRNSDGNGLGRTSVITFRTGKLAPLQDWITFVGPASKNDLSSSGEGVWLVQAKPDLPRPFLAGSFTQATWSSNALEILVQRVDGTWAEAGLDGVQHPLPFTAQWAAFVGAQKPAAGLQHTFAYLDDGTLRLQRYVPGARTQPDPVTVASGVSAAAVEPGGATIAYARQSDDGWIVDGYQVGLGAAFQVATSKTIVDDLAWSQDGTQLAFRERVDNPQNSAPVGTDYRLLAVALGSGSAPVTVVAGAVGNPDWESDDRTLLFTDQLAGQATTRIFRAVVGQSAAEPAAGSGLPTGASVNVEGFELSPDGRQIAYLTEQPDGNSLWLMNADGTGTTRLTGYTGASYPWVASGLSWTPAVP